MGCPCLSPSIDHRIAFVRYVSLSATVGVILLNSTVNLGIHFSTSQHSDFLRTSTSKIDRSTPLPCCKRPIDMLQ